MTLPAAAGCVGPARPARAGGAVRWLAEQFACGLVATALSACAALPAGGPPVAAGIDGVACVLDPAGLPAGLAPRPELPVPPQAQGAGGQGGICHGRVFEVREPLRVYRLWDAGLQNPLGHWWTLRAPDGSREAYRQTYAICRTWSALDQAIACRLKPGALVVIGPGQSADCADQTYPKSPFNQIYVPPDPRDGSLPVEDCSVRPWP